MVGIMHAGQCPLATTVKVIGIDKAISIAVIDTWKAILVLIVVDAQNGSSI